MVRPPIADSERWYSAQHAGHRLLAQLDDKSGGRAPKAPRQLGAAKARGVKVGGMVENSKNTELRLQKAPAGEAGNPHRRPLP